MASVDFTYGASAGPITIEASVGSAKVDFTATAFVAGASAASGNNQVGVVGTTLQPFVLQLTAPAAGGQPANLGGVTVNWSVNQGGGGLVSTTTTTDASGKSSDTLTLGPNPGTNSVTATIPGMGNVTVSFTATAIPAAASIASAGGGNQSGIAGGVLQPFSVQVVANGKGVPGLSVNWSVNQGGGTLSAPISITDANGNASDTLTLGSNPGVNSVTASIAGIGNVVFTAIASATVAGGSQFTIVSGNNQALIPGQASQALVVKLLGPQGNPISGAYVAWTVSGSSGTLVNASTPTDANGQAQNQLTVILPGAYTVTATLANAPGIPALSFSFNNAVANLPGLTPAQIGVAKAIDKACPALAGMAGGQLTPPQRDLLQRCSEIVVGSGNDPQQVPDALNQMLNNKALPQRELANSMQLGQFGNLNTRLGELRQGATGINLSGLTLSQDGRSLPLAMLGDAFRKDPKQDDEIGKDFERWGFFATGMVDRGGFDAMASRPGFDYHNASLTAGVDYRFNADFVAGVALGYNSNHSSFDLNAGKVDVDGYSLNGYFTWYHNNDFYIEGSAIYNSLSYDMTRNIVYQIDSLSGPGLTSVNQSANASPNGNEGSLALSIGKDFNRKAWTFSPYLRGVYSHLSLDGFSESIADPNAPGAGLATSVDARSMTSMLGVLGGRISYTTSYDWGVLVPNAVIEWNHEFRNDPQTVVTRFLADPTQTPIVLSDTPPDSSYFNLGFGLNAVLPQGRSAFVYYEHVVGYTGMHEDRLSIGIRIEF
jgi:outer membrane autotransporter protein